MKRYGTEDRKIAEQAARWQIALKEGGAREREAFALWLLESRRHVRNYLLLEAFDHELKQADAARGQNIDALLAEAAREPVALHTAPGNPRQSPTRRRWALGIAAGAAALGISAYWLASNPVATPEHLTAIGEQQTLKLDDGSIVYLNAASRLRVDFSESKREVRLLDGEALFVVRRDPARPFSVSAGAVVVQVLGTQFNVRREPGETLISVVEGKVAVSRNILVAGEEVRVSNDGALRKATGDVTRRMAWRQRILEFREDPLTAVIAEFNRYNRSPRFRLESASLGERHYTGVFKADDPESLAQLLSEENDITLDRRDGEIVIRQTTAGPPITAPAR